MKLCVVGEKGGTGKSTVATSLAACLASAGRDVMLVDTDTQNSASKWHAVRTENKSLAQMSCVTVVGKGLPGEIRKMAPRYQDVVVDTGGRDTVEMRGALTVCDVAIIPFQPAQFDLWTVEKMYEMFTDASVINPGLRVLAVISRAETNLSIPDYQEALNFIKEFPGMTLATSPLRSRVAFKRASQVGMNVIEFEGGTSSKSAVELQQLYEDIFG